MNNLAYDQEIGGDGGVAQDAGALQAMRPVPRISIQAFCETEGVANPIERAGSDRRDGQGPSQGPHGRRRDGDRVLSLGADAEPHHHRVSAGTQGPHRVARPPVERLRPVEQGGHHRPLQRRVALPRADPLGRVRICGGAVSLADIIGIISTIFVNPDAEPLGRSLAFIGAKGGVGSSTIAHNVAWTVSRLFDSEVVVADMDLAFGTANINFDQDPAQESRKRSSRRSASTRSISTAAVAVCAERLSLLAAPSTLDRVYDFEPDAFAQIIDTAQRSAPVLVMDVPHVWTGWTRTTLMQADESSSRPRRNWPICATPRTWWTC